MDDVKTNESNAETLLRDAESLERQARVMLEVASEYRILANRLTVCKDREPTRRPVMWRVMDDNVWRVFSKEKEAQEFADKIGMRDYQGLYVKDGSVG